VNTNVMHEDLAESQAGQADLSRSGAQVARSRCRILLLRSSLATGQETFYTRDGKAHVEKMTLPLSPVAEEFSSGDLIAAIRGAQADTVRYPEFVKRSTAAGVITCWSSAVSECDVQRRDCPPGCGYVFGQSSPEVQRVLGHNIRPSGRHEANSLRPMIQSLRNGQLSCAISYDLAILRAEISRRGLRPRGRSRSPSRR
jgi:hypothetical protein